MGGFVRLYVCMSHIRILKLHHKMTLIKVPWYVFRVKNLHFWSPSKLSHMQYIIRQGEAELHILDLTSVFYHLPSVSPKHLCALAHLGCTRKVGTS